MISKVKVFVFEKNKGLKIRDMKKIFATCVRESVHNMQRLVEKRKEKKEKWAKDMHR